MKNFRKLASLLVVSALFFSCRNEISDKTAVDDAQIQAEATTTLVDNTDLEIAQGMVDEAEVTARKPFVSPFACAKITGDINTTTFPKTITVDFGTGCTDPKGVVRSGKLIYTITEKPRVAGSKLTVERSNYMVNGNKVEGTIIFANITGTDKVPTWSKAVAGGKITYTDGSVYTFDSQRKMRLVAGLDTPKCSDDTVEIFEGYKNITKTNGDVLRFAISSSLIKPRTCEYITKGTISISGTVVNGTLDFGDGNCDNKGVFTNSAGVAKEITFKK